MVVIYLHCVDKLAFVPVAPILCVILCVSGSLNIVRRSVVVPEPRCVPVKSSRREGKKIKSLVELGRDSMVIAIKRTTACVLVA
jgi:hypothetical protein